ncbi:hypothetical protein GQ457_11G002480 [Hibiscus cannabinus]
MDDTPIKIWRLAERSFVEFQITEQEKTRSAQPIPKDGTTWFPPPRGMLKVNVDASFNKTSKKAAVAAISSSASSAKAFAIRFGMTFAIKNGLSNVIFESDCLDVVNRIKSKIFSAWESASIEEDILNILLSYQSFSLVYASRICNGPAYWVAKGTLVECCPCDWATFVPQDLKLLL